MSYIIDRRLNARKKSTVNRQRFLRRYRKHIKEAVEDAVNQRSITDIDKGGQVTIPRRDISEPIFHHGNGGVRKKVFPGNKEFVVGDEFRRPEGGGGGGGSGSGKASNQGEGEDDFTFQINQDEFLDFMFEGLELPYLVKKQLRDATEYETRRAGYTNAGSPDKIHIIRSLRAANARRIALSGKERRRVRELKKEIETLEARLPDDDASAQIATLRLEIEELEKRIHRLPWIDDYDLKYNNTIRVPVPSSKAVMFCVMDVSGSMTQSIKDIAKRFYILLYLFLKRNYKQIEVVFIRHHTHAKEVDEQEFFYSRETGGTIVSSALNLTADVIAQRYPKGDWNIYVAQASDGDNWDGDSDVCGKILQSRILPKVQYYAYVEITTGPHQNLWLEYQNLQQGWPHSFAMHQIEEPTDIYPVFRKLFERKTEGAA
ncbi:YeaH/YhbH family protein [Marinobacterium arenosum]|uniref:YeaH/YhbH family protein n=1 Tax=Marinobacterium arenosum TaxID=2862496 RepID=UPI001C972082|nr:YeaH/YhbH family protein [Marinobacterium arenosum]MBY4675993.1 YeaH/YhbH family protein [Marinobacterium arenosum]